MGKNTLGKTAWDAIKQAIGKDRKHGWGVKDSMEVIETVIVSEAEAKGYTPSDDCLSLIQMVVNPSAFRQMLESKKVNLLDKDESKERRGNTLAQMASEYGE